MEEPEALDATEPRSTALRLSWTLGALSGGLTVVGFAVVHEVWISDIWFNIGPMVFAGALCGLSVVWSYNSAVSDHSTGRWLAYNGFNAGLLVALGAVSFVVLDPRFTMAEAMIMDDPLAELIPPALPLMIVAMLVGTLFLWVLYGRRGGAVVPIMTTQILLVLLVGHNLAILGLVELSTDLVAVYARFIGLTAFLAGVFAVGVMVLRTFPRPASRPLGRLPRERL